MLSSTKVYLKINTELVASVVNHTVLYYKIVANAKHFVTWGLAQTSLFVCRLRSRLHNFCQVRFSPAEAEEALVPSRHGPRP